MDNDFGKYLAGRLNRINPQNLPTATGLAWYTRETYDQCLAMFEDADDLPGTFDDWLVMAKETEQQITDQGMRCVRAVIDPVEFPRWCAEHGHANINTHARVAYGNFVAMRHLMDHPS